MKTFDQLTLPECVRELEAVIPHKDRHNEEELELFAAGISKAILRHRHKNLGNQIWVDVGRHDLGFDANLKAEDRFVKSWMQKAVKFHGEPSPVGVDSLVRPNYTTILGLDFIESETVFYTACHLGFTTGFIVPDGHSVTFGSRTASA